jgi:hypothetical protein
MEALGVPSLVLVVGVSHVLPDLLHVERLRRPQVLVEDDSPGKEELLGIEPSRRRKVAVGHVVPDPAPQARPFRVEARDGEEIGNVDLLHERLRLLEQAPEGGEGVGVDGLLTIGVEGHRHPSDEIGLEMRVFSAENRVPPDDVPLPLEGFEVVSDRHQVGLGREAIGGVTPVGVVEGAELPRFHERPHPILHPFEVGRA